jgi:hypothetical protein
MSSLILGLNELGFNCSPLLFLCFARVVLENVVHLFESSTLGFGYEEVCPDSGEHTEDGEENIGSVAGILDEGWSDEALLKHE